MYGDGNRKVILLDEDDIATYAIKTIFDDPRTLNKTLHLRPPECIVSQRQLVEIDLGRPYWKETRKGYPFQRRLPCLYERYGHYANQVGAGHFHDMYYEGCLTNSEIGENAEEASKLYPEVKYTRMDEFLKIYV
ncbi:putative oxidoreductase [Rosa chinensis]|uniref:Putative oxidoreductase n=1 Tax=Rosa chinensis TaxID=74649 RepID=A0A2P6PAW6_ROSCH|nr:putative oxidoreductase [Rosa chinensis]